MQLRSLLPIFVALVTLVTPVALHAQGVSVGDTGLGTTASNAGFGDAEDPAVIIGRVVGVALGFVGFIFFAITLYAGILWMTAAGNDEQIGRAKKMITNGVIGVIITTAAYAIATAVVNGITTGTISSGTEGEVPVTPES